MWNSAETYLNSSDDHLHQDKGFCCERIKIYMDWGNYEARKIKIMQISNTNWVQIERNKIKTIRGMLQTNAA